MSAKMPSVRVRLENVVKTFGETMAIHNIDLNVEPGSLTTLLGPSGCGKTTILRLIAGLELPTSGQVFIDDEDVSFLSASRRDVAMVFQSYALFPHMTVGENVGYGLKVQKVPVDERRVQVGESLAAVDLEGYEDRYIDQLSGGQQQRVAVARALILKPKVMLFDEPLSNLDTKLRRQMRDDIRRLQQETGITSFYVTHDQDEALSVSDYVVVMDKGVIAQIGSPEDLYHRPVSSFVATFMGDANILDAKLSKNGNEVSVEIDGDVISLGDRETKAEVGSIQVAIRPQSITPAVADNQTGGLMGMVRTRAYVGAATEYMIDWRDGEIFAVVPAGGAVFSPGAKVHMVLDPIGVAVIGG